MFLLKNIENDLPIFYVSDEVLNAVKQILLDSFKIHRPDLSEKQKTNFFSIFDFLVNNQKYFRQKTKEEIKDFILMNDIIVEDIISLIDIELITLEDDEIKKINENYIVKLLLLKLSFLNTELQDEPVFLHIKFVDVV